MRSLALSAILTSWQKNRKGTGFAGLVCCLQHEKCELQLNFSLLIIYPIRKKSLSLHHYLVVLNDEKGTNPFFYYNPFRR
jgi:hypothetical protein